MSSTTTDRIYLNVPFPAKDQAKSLGARWDPVARKWYVAGSRDLTAFKPWLPPDIDLEEPGGVDTLLADGVLTERGIALNAFMTQVTEAIALRVPRSQWVRAEISQLRSINGGHLAIELVEHDATGRLVARLQAFVWAGRSTFVQHKFAEATGAELAVGLKILFQVSAEFNPTYGLRAIVEDVDPAYTLGDIEARLQAIRDALAGEGILDLNKRLPPPREFCRVAVVSPLDAAGLGDFRRDADRLHEAGICLFVYYTAEFQGADAAASITAALHHALSDHQSGAGYDAVCIIRGGGSVTDLYWLNELELARTVCRLPIPVFTGIGHERDNTVLDEVCQHRCDTPSKVIGWISGTVYANATGAIENLLGILKAAGDAIAIHDRNIELLRRHIESTGGQRLLAAGHDVERLIGDLAHQAQRQLETAGHGLEQALQAVRMGSFGRIDAMERELAHVHAMLEQVGRQRLIDAEQTIEVLAREILGLSPVATLKRGFALAHARDGRILSGANDARIAGRFELEFHDGTVPVRVIEADGGKPE
ncbi:MAG: exodeoxyribonuclease VII large subunit [Methylotetracoccus sp.]